MQRELDNKAKAYPASQRYVVDNVFLLDDTDVAGLLEPAFTTLPTRQSLALWTSMVPRSRSALSDMALSLQSDHYFALYVIGENESDDSQCQSWISGIMESVGQQSIGSYVNEYDFQTRPSSCWGREQYLRLIELKRKWDPTGRICGCLGLEEMGVA